ncbi:Uncharacterized protein DAT39_016028, partial [Clarias magur]
AAGVIAGGPGGSGVIAGDRVDRSLVENREEWDCEMETMSFLPWDLYQHWTVQKS